MTTEFVIELFSAPNAQLIIDRIQMMLNDEKKRRLEFYEWLRNDVKAEFIDGEIIMHSPVKRRHLRANKLLFNLLQNFIATRDLGEVDTKKALVALTRNDYEPDICFWRKEAADEFDEDMMLHPAPELVVEILFKSTTKRDRAISIGGVKFDDYAAHGVGEYWFVDPIRQIVEQFRLDEEIMAFDAVGNYHFTDTLTALTLPGFSISVRAIFDQDANAETLRTLLNKES